MYTLLIVDDEEIVRRGVSSLIDWASLGFTTILQAEDGTDALALAREHRPHLILTDIVMTHMGGLELSRVIAQELPETHVVVLTGHEDFEYAKQSVDLGVKNYILKPIGAAALYEKMTGICKKLNMETAQKQYIQGMKDQLRQSMPALREKFLYSLVCTRRLSKTDVEKRLAELDIHIGAGPYIVGVVEPELPEDAAEHELYLLAVKDIARKSLGDRLLFDDNISKIVAVFDADGLEPQVARTVFSDTLHVIQKGVAATLKIGATCALGSAVNSPGELNQGYGEAITALECCYTLGPGRVYDINDLDYIEKTFHYPTEAIGDLLHSIKFGRREDIRQATDRIARDLLEGGGRSASNIKMVFVEIVTLLLKELSGLRHVPDEFWQRGFQLFHTLEQARSGDQVVEEVWRFSQEISGLFRLLQAGSGHQIVDLVKQYVEENYADPDISLAGAAQRASVSTGYLSALFKKETGTNFVRYLTDARMKKAMELLRNTDKKTYEVASDTGFANPHYFSVAFKKHTGLSPSEYRSEQPQPPGPAAPAEGTD